MLSRIVANLKEKLSNKFIEKTSAYKETCAVQMDVDQGPTVIYLHTKIFFYI